MSYYSKILAAMDEHEVEQLKKEAHWEKHGHPDDAYLTTDSNHGKTELMLDGKKIGTFPTLKKAETQLVDLMISSKQKHPIWLVTKSTHGDSGVEKQEKHYLSDFDEGRLNKYVP